MIRFDTLDRKPKIWNVAILSAVTAAGVAVLLRTGAGGTAGSFLPAGILVCVYMALVIALLMRAYVRQLRYNPYSYNTVYYVGFSLFVLSALATQLYMLADAFRTGLDADAGAAVLIPAAMRMLGSARFYIMLSFPFIAVYSLVLIVTNIWLVRHEGRSPLNLLGIVLAVLLIGGEILLFVSVRKAGSAGALSFAGSADRHRLTADMLKRTVLQQMAVNLYAAVYLYFECMLIGTIAANAVVVRYEPEKNKDYIIVLGCGIRKDGTPTPLLAGRLDRAYRFYQEQIRQTGKAPLFITSGGQGPDEVISESESMKNYLMDKGVPAEHILQEQRSATTYENMLYSKQVIMDAAADDRTADPGEAGKILFATTNYHVFRSGLLARRVKMRAIGIGAKTKWYFWPNASVREFAGLLTKHRLKQALVLGGMLLFYAVSTAALWKMIG